MIVMESSFPDIFACIRCMTYNQSVYITDAMNGFCMQQTNFPFLAIVMDDASTDGEQVVIEDYIKGNFLLSDNSCLKWETEEANWLFAQHRENSNCYFLVVFLKRNMNKQKQAKLELIKEWEDKCKYIALCEGDDYWTDPLKLQKQVDFLEGHEECSMCFHSAIIKNEIDAPIGLVCQNIEDRCYTATELFENWIVPTASIVCRCSALEYPINHPENILNGDIVLVEKCAHSGKVFGMKEKMSVYRIQSQGLTYNVSVQEERSKRYPNHYKAIKEAFSLIDKKTINSTIAVAYLGKGSIEKSVVLKYFDYVIGFFYSPKVFGIKIKRVIRKRLKKVK